MAVRKLALVIVPASSATRTRFVLTAKLGASLTGEMTTTHEFVVLNVPSVAIKMMAVVSLTLVRAESVSVNARLVVPIAFVVVMATVAMFVSDE